MEGPGQESMFQLQQDEEKPQMANYIGEYADQNPVLSTITKKTDFTYLNTDSDTQKFLDKELKKNKLKLPYPNGKEIPEIEIKDEEFLVSGEKIQLYDKFDDSKFSRCKYCGENENDFYCSNKDCRYKNLCQKCSFNCKKNKHQLISLADERKKAENSAKKIKTIFSKYNLEQKKIEINPNLRRNREDNFTESNFDDVNYDTKDFFSTNDIKLIEAIVEIDYKNYFHYQNIIRCENYLNNLYDGIYETSCLKIDYDISNIVHNQDIEYRILGDKFVKNNKDKLYSIINGKRSELTAKTKINKNYLQVILVQKSDDDDQEKYIEKMSFMFCNCKSASIKLSKMKNRKILNLSKVADISNMYRNCSNIRKVDLEFFDVMNNLEKMDSLFIGCKNLVKISHLESLKTNSVTSMNRVFNCCKALNDFKGLNALSGFNVEKVESFQEMFKGCASLESIPGINNWVPKNAKNLRGMFKGCKKLSKMPDISKWNVENVEAIDEMFFNCNELEQFPYLKKWKLNIIKIIDKMIFGFLKLMHDKFKIAKIKNYLKPPWVLDISQ